MLDLVSFENIHTITVACDSIQIFQLSHFLIFTYTEVLNNLKHGTFSGRPKVLEHTV